MDLIDMSQRLTAKRTWLLIVAFAFVSCSERMPDEVDSVETELRYQSENRQEPTVEDSITFFTKLQSDSVFRVLSEKGIDQEEYLNWLEYSYRVSRAADGHELKIDAIDNTHGHPADYNKPFIVTEPNDLDLLREYLDRELSKREMDQDNLLNSPKK
jgi:hypothetical protein